MVPEDLKKRLDQIRSRPNLQSQQQSTGVLSAVEETLREQKSDYTPTAYFAALLSLLQQYAPTLQSSRKDIATAVIYLLDLVTPYVPQPLLRSKCSPILSTLLPIVEYVEAEAPILRSSIGCLVSLLSVQDNKEWALPPTQISPLRATNSLLRLATDERPKVRKQAQNGLTTVLQHKPPSPSLEHPAADVCAEVALRNFEAAASATASTAGHGRNKDASIVHALQLVKAISAAVGGWPRRSIDSLCEALVTATRTRNEYLMTAVFDVFEAIFDGLATSNSVFKLPRLMEVLFQLRPSEHDDGLLPPWIALISRGYDVLSQVEPEETFHKIPAAFDSISSLMSSPSFNIRLSASECLISFLANCVPTNVIIWPSANDLNTIDNLSKVMIALLEIKYQTSWMEVFKVIGAAFECFRWQSSPYFDNAVSLIDGLRNDDAFSGKDQADLVVGQAIRAVGPEAVLKIIPLNLLNPGPGRPGRAWLLPLLRDSVSNTHLGHFKAELVPLSEAMFQKVLEHGSKEKTMEIKIFETVVQQIWSILPGYCDRPLDTEKTFDQNFAELLSNILYQQPEMRPLICKSLQTLLQSLQSVASMTQSDVDKQGQLSIEAAQSALSHISTFAANFLAVLFNVYTQTPPQQRGSIVGCIDSYLSITGPSELSATFQRVTEMLEKFVKELPTETSKKAHSKPNPSSDESATVYALMDIVVTMAAYMPRTSFQALFGIASTMISQRTDPQLQKKAYKIIPRLALSEEGRMALTERNIELRTMLLEKQETVLNSSKRDRVAALAKIVETLPSSELYFIYAVLPEIILATKEVNERARASAFDLIIQMGNKMKEGGLIDPTQLGEASNTIGKTDASIEEYFKMLSAGLAGSTPHMISASVTVISRAVFQFHKDLSHTTLNELLATMDLFLQSNTREVVRSVLGFVKVCVLSFPAEIMKPRLQTLIPLLMPWSLEHKGRFKAKVKNIIERMIRKYGFNMVERNTPDENKKLINNIRKTRDRNKRKKSGKEADDEEDDDLPRRPQGQRFENEFDEAIYGSDDDSATGSDVDADESSGVAFKANGSKKARKQQRSEAYIQEDSDEPLDLLDRSSLGKISSTRPLKRRPNKKLADAEKFDEDGKLVLRDNDDEMDVDSGNEPGDGTLEGGINAYVDAIRGRHAAQRGQRGKLKFSNKRARAEAWEKDDEDDGGAMDIEQPHPARRGRGGGRGGRGGMGARRGRGGKGGSQNLSARAASNPNKVVKKKFRVRRR